ncbi:hypothetical protein GCM10011344_45540 [Dokdonia pacifica]|nr:hypothetical protein GCM10011344_45540 [Dokdonia pacifica]
MRSQDIDLYKNYEFQEFLKTKTVDSGYQYIKTIYRKILTEYPYFENQGDIHIKVLLINDGDQEGIEIIPIDETNNFRKDIIRTLKIANENLVQNDNEKYITEFNITYDYEPHIEDWSWKKELPKIRLQLFKYKKREVILH